MAKQKKSAPAASTLAYQYAHADTPGKKAAVTRKLNQLCAVQAAAGFNPVMVAAGVKAAAKRLLNKN